MANPLLPTAPLAIISRGSQLPEDIPLSKSMKMILNKSERLTQGGREKLVKLIENDTPTQMLSTAFKVDDTVLKQEGMKYERSRVVPFSRGVSPLNVREKRTQFYVKKNFESNLNPRHIQVKMERGARLANQMKELKLKRLIATNKTIHKPSIDCQNRIWQNSLIERAFANRQSEKDLVTAVGLDQETSQRSRTGAVSNQMDTSKVPSTHRSKSVQDQMASLLERLDHAKREATIRLESFGQNKLTTTSKNLIDVE